MADEPAEKPPVEIIPSVKGGISALASAAAPFIYFDGVPNYGAFGGIANITLEAMRYISTPDGVVMDRVSVAHLRMSYAVLAALKDAVNSLNLLIKPAPKQAVN